jgi:protein tyrosine phosphatase (PTP) superfamily phosphohydrolase (DUF442 family)
VHNLFQASTNVFSGSAPEDDAAFAELARLGIKTLISVDGSKPDVETARKYGLRYIHLPFGYDGVPTNRVAELAKAAQSSEGPIYVHCHHGLHRGPAAVAVICQASAGWTTNQAVSWLRQAGTSPDYPGLYRATAEFQMPAPAALNRVAELPEITKPSSIVEAMVTIDAELDRLKGAQKSGWSAIPGHPDLTPRQSTTQLWEQLRELARTDDTARRPEAFRSKLREAERSADQLRASLVVPGIVVPASDASLQALVKTCAACHRQYRN